MCGCFRKFLNWIGLDIQRFPVSYNLPRRAYIEVTLNGGSITLCTYQGVLVNRRTTYRYHWYTFTESGSIMLTTTTNRVGRVGYIIARNVDSFSVSVNGEVIAKYPEE